LLPIQTVFKADIKKDLVDSGSYTAAEVAAGQAK
jgi:putative multiple sugar transport system substrate-binding protein